LRLADAQEAFFVAVVNFDLPAIEVGLQQAGSIGG
jgi:hypothetical protein